MPNVNGTTLVPAMLENLDLAVALLTTIPVAVLFFAVQRHFVRGAREGGVKG